MFLSIIAGSFTALAWIFVCGLLGTYGSRFCFHLRNIIDSNLKKRGAPYATINVVRKGIRGICSVIGTISTAAITVMLKAILTASLSVAAGASFLISLAIVLVIVFVTTY